MIDITIDDRELKAALDRLQRSLSDMSPVMRDIGELLAERAKQRFGSSTGPDGKAWAPNAPSTIAAYLGRHGGRKKGAARAAAKKPLIGESLALSTTIHYQAGIASGGTSGSPASSMQASATGK